MFPTALLGIGSNDLAGKCVRSIALYHLHSFVCESSITEVLASYSFCTSSLQPVFFGRWSWQGSQAVKTIEGEYLLRILLLREDDWSQGDA